MRFTVLPVGSRIPEGESLHAYLIKDNWDDWFQYSTLHHLHVRDDTGQVHEIGDLKIGQFDMLTDQRSPDLPDEFETLSDAFFSVGQDPDYYRNLTRLSTDIREEVLRSVRDIALDESIYLRSLSEDVTGTSLLRFVSRNTIEGQFRRLTQGGPLLTRYEFTYTLPPDTRSENEPPSFDFEVVPNSMPPTNIHVLIGRNGVGKTHILYHMSRALADSSAREDEVGTFTFRTRGVRRGRFANLVSVTFSAFDPFEPISTPRNKTKGLQYTYVGLKRIRQNRTSKPLPPKDPSAIAREFAASVRACLQGTRLARWRRALQMLEADPIFSDAGVADLADSATDDEALTRNALELFRNLSSGHKIVLLTITRLVESVEESSLVLLDEPEAHLHPPLLGAFTRALSDLLINRNGVAIIATHSPVILQEVPSNCAYKLRRSGREMVAERPEVETFGENVGVLTREVFGLEVTRSGFHRLLDEAATGGETYDEVIERFDGQLGGEARGIIRGLIAVRETERGQ
ncbi:AAA family ATPase [Streptomyces sp. NPDC090075]|uniref:AAA family ATPase n=1 Tax=Streptomyces sp. NPDC090075 TaxID=3365937 RepID=UPI00380BF36E